MFGTAWPIRHIAQHLSYLPSPSSQHPEPTVFSTAQGRISRWLPAHHAGCILGPSVLVLVGMKGCLSVQQLLASQEKGPNWLLHKYPDCLYGKYASDAEPEGDVFYFDYGCVAFWGLKVKQVHPMLALPDGYKPAVQQPLGQLSRLAPPLPATTLAHGHGHTRATHCMLLTWDALPQHPTAGAGELRRSQRALPCAPAGMVLGAGGPFMLHPTSAGAAGAGGAGEALPAQHPEP